MMKIEIMGTGCMKCNKLYAAAKQAVERTGVDAEVTKVTDLMEIMKSGVLVTPALVVDGEIKVSGKVPTVEELEKMLV